MQLAYSLPGPVPALRSQPPILLQQVWVQHQEQECSWRPEQRLQLFPHLGALPPCHRYYYPVIVMHHTFSDCTEIVAVHVHLTKAVPGAIEVSFWYN